MAIKTFRDLQAWRLAINLAAEVYSATSQMPDSEKFGLTSQMRRAATAIPSNIAEGFGRQNRPEFLSFLRMARGSLMELQTQLVLVERLQLMSVPTDLHNLQAELDRVLQGLIRSLQNKGA